MMIELFVAVLEVVGPFATQAWEHVEDLNQSLELWLNLFTLYKTHRGNDDSNK